MHDIIDVIKNLQTLSENNSAFKVLKDFERVLDELDIYVFKNWEDGEIINSTRSYPPPKINLADRDYFVDAIRQGEAAGKRSIHSACQRVAA